jgi:ABC-type multidrug transport system fused ATPase/permease subunit
MLGLSRNRAFFALLLSTIAVFFEAVGIASLFPIFEFLKNDGDIFSLSQNSEMWKYIKNVHDFFGISISLISLIMTSFLILMLRQSFSYLRNINIQIMKEEIVMNARFKMFDLYLHTKTKFRDTVDTKKIFNDILVEARVACQASISIIIICTQIILILFYSFSVIYLSPYIFLSCIPIFVVAGLSVRKIMTASRTNSRVITNANRKFTEFIGKRLRSIAIVRQANAEAQELESLKRVSESQKNAMIYAAILVSRLQIFMEPIIFLLASFVIIFGRDVLDLPFATITFFLVAVARLSPAFIELASSYRGVLAATGSIEAVEQLMSQMEQNREPDGGTLQFFCQEAIVFDAVSFAYGNADVPAVKNLSFSMPMGKIIALVGPSGSGKSTIIDLLLGIRRPTNGAILIDGVDFQEFQLRSVRDNITYAPQETVIFAETVREHVAYGEHAPSSDEIWRSLKQSGAEPFIRALPEGLESLIGEEGSNLSGGQRQRLDLARALHKGAPIIVLDEPTSHLDQQTTAEFCQTLINLRDHHSKTVILVTHDPKVATIADVTIELHPVSATPSN